VNTQAAAVKVASGLRSVELGVADVAAQERFYTETWGLQRVAAAGGAVYLRGSGAAHHILALHPRASTELMSVTLYAPSRSAVDAAPDQITSAGGVMERAPATIDEPGGGYGLTFRDPEGRRFRLIADSARHADVAPAADRPERIAHVVFNSKEVPRISKFLSEALNFRLSDQTRMMDFLRSDNDHHNIAVAHGQASTLHHIAFLMPSLDAVMRGAGRMKEAGFPIEWGVGRHGPGNNVFAYFVGPGDVPIEYTGEVDTVDDGYEAHGPDYWKWPPGRIDRWGISAPPSHRLEEAQGKIRFATL
jgi:catechol 2,3-dioxygenase-like lactoylglutathione lyase family enzyme